MAKLTQMSYFGDQAVTGNLLDSKFKLFCATNCHLLVLERQAVISAVKSQEDKLFQSRLAILKAIPFLARLSRQRLKNIVQTATCVTRPLGSYLFHQGEQIKYFFITVKGEFRVAKKIKFSQPV